MNFSMHSIVSVKAFKTEKNDSKTLGIYFSKNLIIEDINGAVIKITLYSHGKKGDLTIINEEGFR